MADMDWDDFRIFLEVVQHGGISRAAVKLNMTQPTVSRRLARLEKAIGARLLEHDGRATRLTFEGQRIYNDTNAAQAALRRTTDRSDRSAAGSALDCNVFTTDGIGGFWITRFLAPFFQRHPEIGLKLFGAQDSADDGVVFDLQVNYLEGIDTDTIATRVATTHLIPFASWDYLRVHGTPQTEQDLGGHRLLDLAAYLSYADTWASRTHQEWSERAVLFTNLSASLVEAARSGAGIAIFPSYIALADDKLVPLDIGIHFQAPIFISHRRNATRKLHVRATLDFLRSAVFDRKNMPWFADSYIPPGPDWPERCAACMKRAFEPAAGDRKKLQKAC